MTTLDEVLSLIDRVDVVELESWIHARWVRPERAGGGWRFTAVDVARVRLIRDIRYEMGVEPETVPLVLDLLDEVYTLRRELRALGEALGEAPPDTREPILRRCREHLVASGRRDPR